MWLSAVALLCYLAGYARQIVPLIVVLLYAAWPPALAAGLVVQLSGQFEMAPSGIYRTLHNGAVLLWYLVSFWRALQLFLPSRRWQVAIAGALYGVALAAMVKGLPEISMFYQPRPAPERLDIETIYYQQAPLLEQQLAQLKRQDPDAVDVYFLSVGAYAGQDVFMREALATRAIVERELGLHGRTMALVNHRRTLNELPLANLPNLQHALRGLAETIDQDQDVVFVYLSSHGSQDATIAADFSGVWPNDISAGDVRGAFDAAGIRWRVIIVSACYSGSFIEALRSPETLVITAAAADRASFGCGHKNAWTYFGEAYFAESLTKTHDLVAAFALARTVIEKRETAEGKLPSRPQIALGSAIEQHLGRWLAPSDVTHSNESTKSR